MRIKKQGILYFFLNFQEYFDYPEKICGTRLPFLEKVKIFINSFWTMLTTTTLKKDFATQLRLRIIDFYLRPENRELLKLYFGRNKN